MKRMLCGILGVALLLGGCSGTGDTSTEKKVTEEIVIASANPMTGDSAQFGDMKVKAMELAIESYNAKGGINGQKIRLMVGDDTGNPKEAPNVAQKIVSEPNVAAVIGHWNSSCTLAAREIYNTAGIPVITDSVNKAITDGTTPNVYRISLTDTAQANQLAKYTYEVLNKKNVAIIYTGNDFGNGIQEDFSKAFTTLGGKVVANEIFFEGQSKDFSPQLTKIKNQKPDLLFIAGYYVEAALIAQQAEQMGLNLPLLGTDGISSEELIKLGGKSVEGIYFTSFFHPEVKYEGTEAFVTAFKAKYNKEPDTYAALAYDSMMLLLKGIEEKGTDRAALSEYIKTAKDFPGVAGPISFENNNVTRNVIISKVENGKIVVAEKQL